jgi:FtsH-binding integral membrane protein
MSKNVGVNRFMLKVYSTTGLSILAALSTSYALLLMPVSTQAIYFLARAGLISTLVGFIGTAVTSPEYTHRIEKID